METNALKTDMKHGVPEHIRSDNGAEFTAQAVREWLSAAYVKPIPDQLQWHVQLNPD